MSNIKLFQNQKIRSQWDVEQEQWLFGVIDVVGALSGSANPRKYWSVRKTRLKKEGRQLATNYRQLKMPVTNCRRMQWFGISGQLPQTESNSSNCPVIQDSSRTIKDQFISVPNLIAGREDQTANRS